VHKYYETTLVDQIDADHLFDAVLKLAGERRTGLERSVSNELSTEELQKISWTEATDSFDAVAAVYDRFDEATPEDEWLKDDLMPRVGRAAALLGKVWDAAFNAAGSVELPEVSVEAVEPEWMPLARQ
jgi:hypothetical protein